MYNYKVTKNSQMPRYLISDAHEKVASKMGLAGKV